AIVVYSPDPETGQAQLMASFHKTFPEIATNYIRLQTGALYAKIMSERQAHAFLDDVLFLTDMSFVLDFTKLHGYAHYVSPQMAAYKPEYKSDPEGDWTWGGIIVAGIAYNPTTVPADQAPKSWKDLLNPAWKDAINVKVSNSGLQHEAWYLIKQIYGDEYWQQFAKLNPRAFDSYVQQFDRCVNGQDKVISTAQYSGYLQFKAKGAPIAFVNPPEGLPADPTGVGIVQEAPHPAAARLFLDWFLSPVGQKAYIESSSLYSPRTDVAPPAGGIPIDQIKLLAPKDWDAFLKTHAQFVKEWDRMVGMR
ncbi:MAG TPA: extracellular solute-binding protein, partial [Acetobacteraceae bacterium]|nr:extracellular solute-binding protein [Acetobacteraceae bacterium]